MYDIITFGGATRDIFFRTGEGLVFPNPEDEQEKIMSFKYGQKIITEGAYFSFGGGAFNAAISFKKMDLDVGVCVNVGKDESAKSITDKLGILGIDISLVTTDEKNHKIGRAHV